MRINPPTNNIASNKYGSNTAFTANYAKFNEFVKTAETAIKGAEKEMKGFTKIEKKKDSKLDKFFERSIQRYAKSGFFKKMSELGGDDALAYAIVLGNAAKEAVGAAIYTVQALSNEDLAPDKRKFIGMYDLGVGIVSTTLSLITGVVMVKGQSKLVNKMLGGELKAKQLPGYAKAFGGLKFILPVVIQTILCKRIIAPAVATPMAGQLKKKLEAKEEKKHPEKSNPLPAEALVLAKTK